MLIGYLSSQKLCLQKCNLNTTIGSHLIEVLMVEQVFILAFIFASIFRSIKHSVIKVLNDQYDSMRDIF